MSERKLNKDKNRCQQYQSTKSAWQHKWQKRKYFLLSCWAFNYHEDVKKSYQNSQLVEHISSPHNIGWKSRYLLRFPIVSNRNQWSPCPFPSSNISHGRGLYFTGLDTKSVRRLWCLSKVKASPVSADGGTGRSGRLDSQSSCVMSSGDRSLA